MAISFTSKKSLQYAPFGAILGLYEIALSKGEIGMTKGEIAKNNFMQGYNCAQAVLLAFCDDLGFDKQTALMLASPFGGGIGRMREVCGTVTGMYMALGLARGYSDSKDNADKKRVYTEVQQLAERFKEDNGSIICRDLLGMRAKAKDTPTPSERTEKYYAARPCPELCRYAADLLDEYLKNKKG
mgnify:FL=1